MSDKTMEDIKNGNGLEPISSDSSQNDRPGITSEQRGQHGISHEIFTYNWTEKNRQGDRRDMNGRLR